MFIVIPHAPPCRPGPEPGPSPLAKVLFSRMRFSGCWVPDGRPRGLREGMELLVATMPERMSLSGLAAQSAIGSMTVACPRIKTGQQRVTPLRQPVLSSLVMASPRARCLSCVLPDATPLLCPSGRSVSLFVFPDAAQRRSGISAPRNPIGMKSLPQTQWLPDPGSRLWLARDDG